MPEAQNMDLFTLMDKFHSEERCIEYLEELRWPDGVVCPRCGCTTISRIKKRNQFDCDGCRYQFSVKSGTVLHDSHLPLRKWFAAVYLMCESKKSISANQLKRTLKVAYKTAWYLCHRIRHAMADADTQPLEGVVECDEMYLGPKRPSYMRRDKLMILGAIERGGNVRFKVGKRANKESLHKFIKSQVDMDETDAIYTDQHGGYIGIGTEATRHETVNHSADEWVRGDVHTNSIEGAFGLFQRSLVGAYHQISAKHLPAYLDEFEFRFDNRKNPYLFRDTILRLIATENLEYKELTSKGL